ncbi:MAG: Ig-like domain-containing protein [Oscillospiraceae bacterium]|nr:Ig-like domain-containing protein [Oscillospiraceae bacterium]
MINFKANRSIYARVLSCALAAVFIVLVLPVIPSQQIKVEAAGNDAIGLGHLLKGYNTLGNQQLLAVNLKRNIFKSDAYNELSNYCHFNGIAKASNNVTIIEKTMEDYAKSYGVETAVKASFNLNLILFKAKFEEKISFNFKDSLKETRNALFYESTTWRREAIYDIDFGKIPHDVIQSQLSEQFKSDIVNMPVERLFNTYGTHFLTEYTLGGWAEAGVHSADNSVIKEEEIKTGVEGTITALYNSKVGINSFNSRYRAFATTYGGFGGLAISSDINTVNSTINSWISSFNRSDYWNVCEIVTIPGDGNNRINAEGIWELLPKGYEDRRYELMEHYMEQAMLNDIAFNNAFIYKNINTPSSADVDAERGAASYEPEKRIAIESASDFSKIGNEFPIDGDYYMVKDIDFINYQGDPSAGLRNSDGSSKVFTGTFDGNGLAIENYNYRELYGNRSPFSTTINSGIFPEIGENAVIRNLTVKNSTIEYRNVGSGITGSTVGIPNDITYRVGVITGYNGGTIENCHVRDSMSLLMLYRRRQADMYSGGIAGYNAKTGRIINSSFTSDKQTGRGSAYDLTGTDWDPGHPLVGRIIYSDGTLGRDANIYASARYNSGTSSRVACHAGGIAGYTSGEISDCYAKSNTHTRITRSNAAFMYSGGIAGLIEEGSIKRSYSYGTEGYSSQNVTLPLRKGFVGKIVGKLDGGKLSQNFLEHGGVAIGNRPDNNPDEAMEVTFFNNPDVINVLRSSPNSKWDDNNNSLYPTHKKFEKKPTLIVEFLGGKPDFYVGDVISVNNLSRVMTVHFTDNPNLTPVEHITNSDNLRVFYDFSTVGEGLIYFEYTKDPNAEPKRVYLGVLSVPLKTLSINTENPTELSLDKSNITLESGGLEQLEANLQPRFARREVIWSSSNENVANVTSFGQVFALEAGEAVITATSAHNASLTATCAVTVTAPEVIEVEVTGVALNKSQTTILTGESELLTAITTPANATNQYFIWSSDDENIATVDESGFVTAVSAGTATVTVATDEGGFTADCIVTVTDTVVAVTGVSLDKDELALGAGGAGTLNASITPADATNQNVTWSSSDEAVAWVNSGGVVIAVGAGTAVISVKTDDGGFTDICNVTVANTPIGEVCELCKKNPCECKPGNVTGSGDVNTLDVLAVLDHIYGAEQLEGKALSLADVNGDGLVNILDALALLDHIYGVKPLY